MRINALGPIELRDGTAVADLGPPLQRALVALLLSRADRVVAVDTIVDLLWDGQPPAKATASLQVYISRLRGLLEPDRSPRAAATVLVTRAPGYLLDVSTIDVDVRDFVELTRQAVEEPPERALAILDKAIGLWRGDPYADVGDADWIAPEVNRLRELRLTAIEDRATALLSLNRAAEAIVDLQTYVTEQPLRERGSALLARALYATGRQADALAVLRSLRERLDHELGVNPSEDVRNLETAILRQDEYLRVESVQLTRAAAPMVEEARPSVVPVRDERPFVGRAGDEHRLLAALDIAGATGRPHVVVVDGEPGIGKTRLVEHVTAALPMRVLWGSSPEHEVAPPLWPWEQALRGLPDATPQEVLDLLAAPDGADSVGARLRLYEAIIDWLSDQAPIVVVLDDLHWADTSSLRLLALLAASPSAGPVTVVATVRRHETTGLTATLAALARAGATRLSLEGLAPDAVQHIAAELTGEKPSRAEAEALQRRTGGNPFFLQQLVRLPNHTDTAAVPAQVRDVVLARVARLPEQLQQLLTVAALPGLDVDSDITAEVADHDDDEAIELFDGAVAAGLLHERDEGLSSYRFTHALVRDALVSTMTRARKARLHRRFGEVTARRWAGIDDRAGEIARHWLEAAGLDPTTARQAMQHAARAAQVALHRYAPEDAAMFYQDALAAADLAGADGDDRFELLLGLALAHQAKGDTRDMLAVLDNALEFTSDDVCKVARVADAAMGRTIWYPFDYGVVPTALLTAVESALARVDGKTPVRSRVLLRAAYGVLLTQIAELDAARDSSRQAVADARAVDNPALLNRVLHLALLTTSGVDLMADQLVIATELASRPAAEPEEVATAALAMTTARMVLGDYAAARRGLDDVIAAAHNSRRPTLQTQAAITRLGFLGFEGRYTEAATLADATEAAIANLNAYGADAGLLVHRIDVAYQLGTLGRHFDALHWMVAQGFTGARPTIALALTQLGRADEAKEVLAACDAPPKDYTWLAWAGPRMLAALDLGMPELAREMRGELEPYRLGFIVLGSTNGILGAVEQWLGEASLLLGEHDRARRELTSAVARLQQAGAGYWLRRAQQALARVGDDQTSACQVSGK